MRARLALVASASALCAGAALWRCSDDGAGGDAGDAVADVGREVRYLPEAGDAGAVDGACSVTSDWPGFRRLTEFDPCLPADVLVDPEAGYKMTWTDCGDAGIAGCKDLEQVSPHGGVYAYATHDEAGAGNFLYLEMAVVPQNATPDDYDIVDLKSSATVGEWRVDIDNANGTQIVLPNTTASTAAFLGYKPELNAEFAPAQTLFAGPLALTAFPSAPMQPINWAISDDVMAWQSLNAPYSICRVDAGACIPLTVPAALYLTFAWGDVAFATAEHGTTGWGQEYVIHTDGSVALLRSNPSAHVWALTTDGTTLVWEETYGTTDLNGQQTTTEIWKAPFTTDKATLDATATKVATLPQAGLGGTGIAELDFFNGLYATYLKAPADVIYVVDVVSGKTQTVPKGPGGNMLGLPYVDRSELWEVTSTVNYLDSLVRIPFAQPWN